MTPTELSREIKLRGRELGFELVGITPAARPDTFEEFQRWLRLGRQATMDYLPNREAAYAHPDGVLPGVRSLIIVGLNYGPPVERSSSAASEEPPRIGRIAAYAQGSGDYHDVLRGKLHQLADALKLLVPESVSRCVVDTAPLLERDAAQRAGLGWFGKNTMLINKHRGSYFFLGAVLTDVELAPDEPHFAGHCGTCTRCLEACPTGAFPEPYVLDANRCISYLTIELRGAEIPVALREGVGDWLFGCDVCQQVCPWNRKAVRSGEPAFHCDPDSLPHAADLVTMDAATFRRRFKNTPLWRPGREGLVRNAIVVLANSGDDRFLRLLEPLLADESAVVRSTAEWAISRLRNAADTADGSGTSNR